MSNHLPTHKPQLRIDTEFIKPSALPSIAMELSDIFRIVNLVVAAITVLGGVFHFFGLNL